MKKLIIALIFAAAISGGAASAQRHFYGGGRTVIVNGGYYPYAGLGLYYGYPYPYYPYGAAYPPSKLDMQIASIKADYDDKIASVRMDNSLTGKQRREKVREFKRERDEAVQEARVNYYKN